MARKLGRKVKSPRWQTLSRAELARSVCLLTRSTRLELGTHYASPHIGNSCNLHAVRATASEPARLEYLDSCLLTFSQIETLFPRDISDRCEVSFFFRAYSTRGCIFLKNMACSSLADILGRRTSSCRRAFRICKYFLTANTG